MPRRLVLAAALIALFAAFPARGSAQGFSLDASIGFDDRSGRVAVALPWRLDVGSYVRIGAGPRLTYYAGEPLQYRNEGRVLPALPRRLTIDPSILGLNLMVMGELRPLPWLGGGANLDLAGVAVGPDRSDGGTTAEVARGSLFLYGSNDRGSLNSEFYLIVTPLERWVARLGVSHYVTGYRAESGGTTSRYLRFDTVPFVAAEFAF